MVVRQTVSVPEALEVEEGPLEVEAEVSGVFEVTQAAQLPIHPYGNVPVILSLHPELPVGGRLQYFADQWALIRADRWSSRMSHLGQRS